MPEQQTLAVADLGIEIPADPLGVSTGERLRAQRPDTYALVVQMLSEGCAIRQICRASGLHHRTIMAVRDGEDHAGSIDTAKTRAARNLSRFVEYAAERLVDEADSIPIGQLAVPFGIAVDKLQLLQGAPTSIVETRAGPSHDDLNAWLENMRRAQPVSGGEDRGKREGSQAGEIGAAATRLEVGSAESLSVVREHSSEEEL